MDLKPFRFALVVLLTGLLASCAMAPKVSDDLTPSVYDFAERLRWKDFHGASRYFVEEDNRNGILQTFSDMKDLEITDIVIQSIDITGQGQDATTTMVMEYFLLPSVAVKTYRFQLQWRYSGLKPDASDSWRIVSPFPSFP